MSRVVHLHIGAPKTGTTYVQDRLGLNARALSRHGVRLPVHSRFATTDISHFRAALDLLGQDWGGPPGHADGAWDALVGKVRGMDGNVVISHEILAGASAEQARRALTDLGPDEVRIVYSARDLARQLPAAWQESVKQGRAWTLAEFMRRAQQRKPVFMRAFDIPRVLSVWGAGLAPEQVTLVVVPPASAPADTLWLRMCQALGIDPAWAPVDSEAVNASLSAPQTEVLRRLNRRLGRRDGVEGEYDALLLGLVNGGRLFSKNGPAITVPPDAHDWMVEVTGRHLEWIQASGIRVIGEVADLIPPPPAHPESWTGPLQIDPEVLYGASLDAMANLTRELAARPNPEATLSAKAKRELNRRIGHRPAES